MESMRIGCPSGVSAGSYKIEWKFDENIQSDKYGIPKFSKLEVLESSSSIDITLESSIPEMPMNSTSRPITVTLAMPTYDSISLGITITNVDGTPLDSVTVDPTVLVFSSGETEKTIQVISTNVPIYAYV
jgi:hypothetical protein